MSRGRRQTYKFGNEYLSITELLQRPEVSYFVTRGTDMSHASQRESLRRRLRLGNVTPQAVAAYNQQNPVVRQQPADTRYGAQRRRAGLPQKDTLGRVI